MPQLIITLTWVVTLVLVVQYAILHPDFRVYEVLLPQAQPDPLPEVAR